MSSNDASPLGRTTGYPDHYDPALLFPIERAGQRPLLGIHGALPFAGADIWTAYEISWLDLRGKPQLAVGELRIAADSPATVESKSLKLYLGSFAQDRVATRERLAQTIAADLDRVCRARVGVVLHPVTASSAPPIAELPGLSLDGEDGIADTAAPDPALLLAGDAPAEETLHSALFRSNCPVTGQPDYADVMVRYRGPRIDRVSLLSYLLSYRRHAAFHESCVEQIYVDIAQRCRTERLTVYARFMRRGGIDINPFRSNWEAPPASSPRTPRQ
ncbi:MAG TPA: NADPH-dependent 7-cyano-7-deazaguanine reductase QueF [Casimicrobiaceae bacterium]|jgi:7-cyano-7-deazaguanine reductase